VEEQVEVPMETAASNSNGTTDEHRYTPMTNPQRFVAHAFPCLAFRLIALQEL
jgi:hypothetical protein